MKEMTDMNGKVIHIGDKIRPNGEGRVLLIVSQFEVEGAGMCLFGQQIEDPLAFSPLNQEELSKQWILIEE